jgi:hypothetical protein
LATTIELPANTPTFSAAVRQFRRATDALTMDAYYCAAHLILEATHPDLTPGARTLLILTDVDHRRWDWATE